MRGKVLWLMLRGRERGARLEGKVAALEAFLHGARSFRHSLFVKFGLFAAQRRTVCCRSDW